MSGQKLGHKSKFKENLVNTLEAAFFKLEHVETLSDFI